MRYQIAVKSRLPLAMRGQLESLLFFNAGQHRMRTAIQASIERYGIPELTDEGGWLQLKVAGLPAAQTLFAVHEAADGSARPVGAVVYLRDSFERITVVHVSVADDHAQGGRYARDRVLPRLLQEIRQVARSTAGIRHVKLAYRRERLAALGVA
jgi:hypothetical protein